MLRIWIRTLRLPFERFKFGFEYFESLSNGSNFHSNTNPIQLVRIWIRIISIHSNGSNLNLNASNPFRTIQTCIRMLRIPLEWIEFGFEFFESISNGLNLDSNVSNLDSNALNPFRMVRIWIPMLWIAFEWFEFGFECFKSLSNYSNLDSNAANPFQMDLIWIRMLRNPFDRFEFGFEYFESFPMVRISFLMVRISIRMIRIPLNG